MGLPKQESSVDQIVNGIKKMMINQELKIGDRVPSEFELSEKFGKSRSSVREAIKILISYGVLEVRRGDGTYVCSSVGAGVFDALFFQIIALGTELSDLIQLREILENGLLKLIISQGDEHCLREITEAQKNLEDAILQNADLDTLVKLDSKFHGSLAKGAHNEIVEKIYSTMLDIFEPFIKYSYMTQKRHNSYSVSNHHKLIIQAVEERDMNLARYAVKKSLEDWMNLNHTYTLENGSN